MHDALEESISDRTSAEQPENSYASCKIQAEEVNKYLQKSAEFYDLQVRSTVFEHYDVLNQQLYWYRFLVDAEHYQIVFTMKPPRSSIT